MSSRGERGRRWNARPARRWPRRAGLSIGAAVLLVALVGCGAGTVPPAIELGSTCRACGMDIQDLRFACERRVEAEWRVYDSIECLLRDRQDPGVEYLADYDSSVLHAADSLWVVHGGFPSPMGGGLAAFAVRAAADQVAEATDGRVVSFANLAAAAGAAR